MPTETGNTCPILTGTRQSGLSRERIYGKLQPMNYGRDHHPGTILFLLVLALIVVVFCLLGGL